MRFKQFFILIVLDQLTRGVRRISRVDGFFSPIALPLERSEYYEGPDLFSAYLRCISIRVMGSPFT